MKLLPASTRIPRNVPHVKLARGLLVPDAYADALQNPLPLGDWVEAVTTATGIKRAWQIVKRGNCGGCARRRDKLNQLGAKVARAVAG